MVNTLTINMFIILKKEGGIMSQDFDHPDLVHQAIDLMIRFMRSHHRAIDRLVADKGLHRGQHRILMLLSQMQDLPSQRELADRFDISPACMARSLKTLSAEGYIARSGDADDQRRNQVSITDKGLQILEEARETFDAFDQAAFRGFTGAELNCLISMLNRLQDNLGQLADPDSEHPHPKKGSVSL